MEDLSQQTIIDRDVITENLRCRLQSQMPYTMCRDVCISVNPCKWLPLYTEKHITQYHTQQKLHELEPHVYKVAERAYRQMYDAPQTILISGESGSGKTELTKLCVNYFATIGPNAHIHISRTLQTNLIFEFLGNAQTLRNNNSSRFGKFLELYYVTHEQIGASVQTYLFERSRVTQFDVDNAGFHIVYAVLAEQCDTKCCHDGFSWSTFVDAMKNMGANSTDVREIWNIIRIVVKLIDQDDELAASLLGIHAHQLIDAFTVKTINVVNQEEVYTATCEPAEVDNRRRALSMFLYTRMFEHTVALANRLICDDPTSLAAHDASIGLLDIYGFESFAVNCFEQFCINYCNERLQCIFVDDVLTAQQNEYATEGLPWKPVPVGDTRTAIALCERHIIDKLDEACRLKRQPFAFLSEIAAHNPPKFSRPLVQGETSCFTIEHFVEPVTYTADKFMEKNIDELRAELLAVLKTSNKRYIRELLPESKVASIELWTKTISTNFKEHLRQLVSRIESTQTHHLRCIKANDTNTPLGFDVNFVARQVDYSGLVHACEIMRTDYTHHIRLANITREFSRCRVADLTRCGGKMHMGVTRVYMNTEAYNWLLQLNSIRKITHAFRNLKKYRVENDSSRYIIRVWRQWIHRTHVRYTRARTRIVWSTWLRMTRQRVATQRSASRIQVWWRAFLRERTTIAYRAVRVRNACRIQMCWRMYAREKKRHAQMECVTQQKVLYLLSTRRIQSQWRAFVQGRLVDPHRCDQLKLGPQKSQQQCRIEQLETQLGERDAELFRAKQTIMALCGRIDKLKDQLLKK